MTDLNELAAREERARIVAWLRSAASTHYARRYSFRERLFFLWTALVWPENLFTGAWLGIADKLAKEQSDG